MKDNITDQSKLLILSKYMTLLKRKIELITLKTKYIKG